jgi:hypothetical protein
VNERMLWCAIIRVKERGSVLMNPFIAGNASRKVSGQLAKVLLMHLRTENVAAPDIHHLVEAIELSITEQGLWMSSQDGT